jgi:spore coat polysaccharide biosynthesis protein SpsF
MKKYIFIQARMSSQRLPGKVLLPFKGSTVLKFLYDKCRGIRDIEQVVVLTSDRADDDKIELICKANNMLVYRGNLFNVLDRFQEAAKLFCNSDDIVIRLCADSPLISKRLLQDFANNISSKFSFFSTRYLEDGVFISTTGKGNNIDAFTVAELARLNEHNELVREHIIYGFDYGSKFCLYKTEQIFNQNECIDTLDDYQRLS